MPEKKDYVSVRKEYIMKNFANCKSLCLLQEIYTVFKEKHPNLNIVFSKFCALIPKWCFLPGSKMTHSVCVCSAHQYVVLILDAIEWDLTYKDIMIKLIFSCFKYFHKKIICDHFYITFIDKSILLTAASSVHHI